MKRFKEVQGADEDENFARAGRDSSKTKSVHSIEVLKGKSLHIVERYFLSLDYYYIRRH